jgi:hypothetical protein
MGHMDTTRDLPELLDRLRATDPAAAPDLADELARRLASLLEEEDVAADTSAPAEAGPVKEGESS